MTQTTAGQNTQQAEEFEGVGFQDDAFWTDFHDFLFSEQRTAQAEELLDTSPLFTFPERARVLDVCCGPGVFTAPLARRGYATTGVDRSAAMLELAAKACRANSADARLVAADVLDFAEPGAYDVVLNLFTSFGYFERPADNVQVLRNMHACLAPGGQLLLDVAGKEILARKVLTPKVIQRGPDVLVQTDSVLDEWARLRSDWTLVRGERVQRACLVWFVYSAVELRGMAEEAGFGEVEIFGGFDGRPYDEHADRLILRAVRHSSD